MTATVVDYVNVRERAASLGCVVPERIAILPVNFDSVASRSEFNQLSEAATVRTLFRTNHVPTDELLPKEERSPYIQNNSFDWVAPTLFVSASLWTQNPMAVSLALNVLASYITDFFKGAPGKKTVKLDVVIEKKGDHSCKKLKYEGDIAGLGPLSDIIRQIADD